MNLTHKILKKMPALVTCTLMITILSAPILSISLRPFMTRESTLESTNIAIASTSTTRDEFFDPSGYDIVNYAREEAVLANRSLDSEDLLFGSVDNGDDESPAIAPADSTFTEDNKTVYVDVAKLNMREYPGLDAPILLAYVFGDSLKRTGISPEWARVENSKGVEGYVKADYITTTKPVVAKAQPKKITPSKPAKANTLGEALAKEARKYIGIRYRRGEESPSKGFDCTGLTSYVYSRYGVNTPRASSAYYNAGTVIPYSQIAPGDVIAWDTRKYDRRTTITHVGMYIGNGMMIHASSSNSSVKIVSVAQYREWGCKLLSVHRFIKK